MDLLAIILAVAASLCWAVMWLMMKLGVDEMSWVGFGLLRPWMGLPFIVLYAWATGGFSFGSPTLMLAAIAGGFLNAFLGTGLFYYAHTRGSLHETNILANTGPFWGVIGAIAFLSEPARLLTLGTGALVIAGAYLLVRRGKKAVPHADLRARIAALGAGMLWGLSAAVPTKFCMDGGMSPIAHQVLFTGSAAFWWTLAAAPALYRRQLRFTRKGLWIAFASSFTGLFVGWVLWLVALQRVDASALSPLNGLTLLFSVILGALYFRERITGRIFAGGALILAGVTLISVFAG